MTLEEVKSLEQEEPAEQQRSLPRIDRGFSAEIFRANRAPTAISPETLKQIVAGLTTVPDDFNILPKVKRITIDRQREVYRSRRTLRLGICRGARFRFAPAGGRAGAFVGPGQPARHFQPSARVSLRCENGQAVSAAAPSRAEPGADLHLQQPAFRSRGPRFRLRLLARLPEHALPLGSAVRRFREWRADHHRSVHRLGGIEMAAAERNRASSCRTATKARDRSIPARGSSVSSRPARKTISRSATSRPRRNIFTFCAGR